MWSSITGRSSQASGISDSKPEKRKSEDDGGKRRSRTDPTASSSTVKRKSSRREDSEVNNDGKPTSTVSSSFPKSSRDDGAAPSVASSYVTAYTNEPLTYDVDPPEPVRNKSTGEKSSKSESGERRRSSKRESRSERSRGVDDDDVDDERRNAKRRDSDKSRRESKRSEKPSSSRKDNSRGVDDANPSLVQNQFPGEFPDTYAEPYRPPGLAADYYHDHGESVATQPGVRPAPPSIVTNAEMAHLMEPTTEAKPPPEPSSIGQVGAAASFYADMSDTGGAPAPTTPGKGGSQKSELEPGTMEVAGGTPRSSPGPDMGRPPPTNRPSGGIGPMGSAVMAPGVGAAAEYFTGNIPITSANDQQAGGYQTYTQNQTTSFSQTTTNNGQPSSGLSRPSTKPSNSNIPLAAAGLAAAGAGAYLASHHTSEQHAEYQNQAQGSRPDFQAAYSSAAAMSQQQQQHRHKRRSPIGKFVDWFRDPNGVAEFEEYSEAIGVCKYCFDPNSSPRDAPRRHHYKGRRYSGSRYGSSTRVDKVTRYSSDEERRRRSSTTKKVVVGGIAAYGAAKIGEAIYNKKYDFDDTNSVKSGRPINGSRVSFKEEDERYSTSRRKRYESNADSTVQRRDSGRRSNDRMTGEQGSSRRPDSSGLSTGLSQGAALSAGVAAAAGIAAATSSQRRRSRSPAKRYYSKRVSPQHSYVDLTTTNDGSVGFGSFFSSPSANQRKGKKAKGLFRFSNESSSSSDADLAFGEGTVRRKPSRKGRNGDKNDSHEAILGLAATGVALAAETDRLNKRKGKVDSVAARDSRNYSKTSDKTKISLQDHETSESIHDDVWVDASDDDTSSVDTNLAYGSRLSARRSRESMGLSKWDWRWNSKERREEERLKRKSSNIERRSYFDTAAAGLVGAGVGIAAVEIASSRPSQPDLNTPNLPPMRHLDPVPASTVAAEVSSINKFSSSDISPRTSDPRFQVVPNTKIEQPQPITPISSIIYDASSAGPAYSDRSSSQVTVIGAPKRRESVKFDLTEEQQYRQQRDEERTKRKQDRDGRGSDKSSRRRSRDADVVAAPDPIVQDSPSRVRGSSVDAREAREAEIERELQILYEEDRRQTEARKKRAKKAAEIAAVAVAVGAGVTAAAISKHDTGSDEERKKRDEKPRRRSSLKKTTSKEEEELPPVEPEISETQPESMQERIARRAAQRINRNASPSPVYEDYSTFFVPPELAINLKEHNHESEHRDDPTSDGAQVVDIVPRGTTNKGTFDPFLYRPFGMEPDDDPMRFPWPVPKLGLVEPTPPHSRAPSSRGDVSPVVPKSPEVEPVDSPPKETRQGSRVSWGDHDTYVYEVQTPEYERSDFTSIDDLPSAAKAAKDMASTEVTQQIPPIEEMTREQQEHMSMGKPLAELPPSKPEGESTRSEAQDTSIIKDRKPSASGTTEYNHDLEFAAVAAAGASLVGFDSKTVTDDPNFHSRSSPPGSNDMPNTAVYQSPFAETVSDLGSYADHNTKAQSKVDGQRRDRDPDEKFGNGDDATAARLSKSEKRRQERATASTAVGDTPGNVNVFDYLEDANGHEVPSVSALGIDASSTISSASDPQRDDSKSTSDGQSASRDLTSVGEEENFAKPKRALTLGDITSSVMDETLKSKTGYASDPETPGKSSKKSKKSKKSSKGSSDLDSKAALAGATVGAAALVDDFYGRKKSSKTSKRDSQVFGDDDDDTQSAVSAPAAFQQDEDPSDDKKSRRKSKRDSEIFDDDAMSVTSTPADSKSEKGVRRKSQDKKSGGFFGLFSSSKSDVSTTSSSSKRKSKDSGGDRKKREQSADDATPRRRKSSVTNSDDIGSPSSRRSRSDSRTSSKGVDRDQSVDDGFVSAEEAMQNGKNETAEENEVPFLEERPEMPTGSDGASGLSPENALDDSEEKKSVFSPMAAMAGVALAAAAAAAAKSRSLSTPNQPTATPETKSLPQEDEPSSPALQSRQKQLARLRISDINSSPVILSSPTAIPLNFRRLPGSPIPARRSSFASPGAFTSPVSPLTTPRTRQGRPTSTEFRSKEVRPLYLVERHSYARQSTPDVEETYPSLPSSRTTSAHPSIEDLRGAAEYEDAVAAERITADSFHKRRHSYSVWDSRPKSPEYLDSRTVTPTQTEFPTSVRDPKKEKPKYEFHSPSELLEDPALHSETRDIDPEEAPGSPLPSVVSSPHDGQDFVSLKSRSRSPSPNRKDSLAEQHEALWTTGVGAGLVGGAAAFVAADAMSKRHEAKSAPEPLQESSEPTTTKSITSPSLPPVKEPLSRELELPAPLTEEPEELPLEPVSSKKQKKDKKKKKKTFKSDDPTPESSSSTRDAEDVSEPVIGELAHAQPTDQVMSKDVEEESRVDEPTIIAEPAEDDEWNVPTKKSKKDKTKKSKRQDSLPLLATSNTASQEPSHNREMQIPTYNTPVTAVLQDDAATTSAQSTTELIAEEGSRRELQESADPELNEYKAPDSTADAETRELIPEAIALPEDDELDFGGPITRTTSESFVPTLIEVNRPGNQLSAFEEAFQRACAARGFAPGVSRDEALEAFLPNRNNAPFVAKDGLSPIAGSKPNTPAPSPPQERMEENVDGEQRVNSSKSKKDKKKDKKAKKASKLRDVLVEEPEPPEDADSIEPNEAPRDLPAADQESASAPESLGVGASVLGLGIAAVAEKTLHDDGSARKLVDTSAIDAKNSFGNNLDLGKKKDAAETLLPLAESDAKEVEESVDYSTWAAPISKKDRKKEKKAKKKSKTLDSTDEVAPDSSAVEEQPEATPPEIDTGGVSLTERGKHAEFADHISAEPEEDGARDVHDVKEPLVVSEAAAELLPKTTLEVFAEKVTDTIPETAVEEIPVPVVDEEEWGYSTKKSKKDKKKKRKSTTTLDEPLSRDEEDKEPVELLREDINEPVSEAPTADAEKWGVNTKKSKKEKRKQKSAVDEEVLTEQESPSGGSKEIDASDASEKKDNVEEEIPTQESKAAITSDKQMVEPMPAEATKDQPPAGGPSAEHRALFGSVLGQIVGRGRPGHSGDMLPNAGAATAAASAASAAIAASMALVDEPTAAVEEQKGVEKPEPVAEPEAVAEPKVVAEPAAVAEEPSQHEAGHARDEELEPKLPETIVDPVSETGALAEKPRDLSAEEEALVNPQEDGWAVLTKKSKKDKKKRKSTRGLDEPLLEATTESVTVETMPSVEEPEVDEWGVPLAKPVQTGAIQQKDNRQSAIHDILDSSIAPSATAERTPQEVAETADAESSARESITLPPESANRDIAPQLLEQEQGAAEEDLWSNPAKKPKKVKKKQRQSTLNAPEEGQSSQPDVADEAMAAALGGAAVAGVTGEILTSAYKPEREPEDQTVSVEAPAPLAAEEEEEIWSTGKKKSKKEKRKRKTLLFGVDDNETGTSQPTEDSTPANELAVETPAVLHSTAAIERHQTEPAMLDDPVRIQEDSVYENAPPPTRTRAFSIPGAFDDEGDEAVVDDVEEYREVEEPLPIQHIHVEEPTLPTEHGHVDEHTMPSQHTPAEEEPEADVWYTSSKKNKKSKKEKKSKKNSTGFVNELASASNKHGLEAEAPKEANYILPNQTTQQTEKALERTASDAHTDVPEPADEELSSDSTRRERRRRRSPIAWSGEEPEDFPGNRSLTPPAEHDAMMDTALTVAAGLGLTGAATSAIESQSHGHGPTNEAAGLPPPATKDAPTWSFASLDDKLDPSQNLNRDSGIQFADSPTLSHGQFHTSVRDSGFVPSPAARWSGDNTHDAGSTRPPRPQSPTSSSEDIRAGRKINRSPSRSSARNLDASGFNPTSEHHTTHELLETPGRKPSPVTSTTKDRSSALFDSSPSNRTDPYGATPKLDTRHLASPTADIHRTPSIHGHHRSREELREHEARQSPSRQYEAQHPSSEQGSVHHESSRNMPTPSFHNLPSHESHNRGLSPPKTPLHTIPEHISDISPSLRRQRELSEVGSPRRGHPTEHPEKSEHEFGEAAAIAAVAGVSAMAAAELSTRDHPATADSKSLGRSNSRSTSSTKRFRDVDPRDLVSHSTDASVDESGAGKETARNMADIYDGHGQNPGPSMSPTRPPSVRRRQSMQQIKDLEARLDQLAAENRSLAEAKIVAERHLEDLNLHSSKTEYASQEALQTANLQLREKDEDIAKLREGLGFLQNEVQRLTAVNQELTTTQARVSTEHEGRLSQLQEDHEQRYSQLRDEHADTHQQWQESSRELDTLRSQHTELSTGMEEIVRQEIGTALAEKNAEIERLRGDLELARHKIRELQEQILSTHGQDIIELRDEDYFDNSCQQLCHHVQQWVLRFSKFSDTRVCRSTHQVRDDKVIDRFDNAILDGSEVDVYLGDRIKRRDVFMSVIMNMIWEYVFTRYLFGMDREQRQKLKQLEKNLSEVGTQSAVRHWRAMTLTLLAKREAFMSQRESDTEAVAAEVFNTLAKFLPTPPNLEKQISDSLRNVMKLAVDLSIEMRTQRAEYIMLPPLQPEYDTNGDLARKVYFNASLMNERSGETTSNEELEAQHAVVRMVLFPLVVKKGSDDGEGDEEIVVCPAQVLVAKSDKGKSRVQSRVVSDADRMSVDQGTLRSTSVHSFAPSMDPGNVI